MNEPRMWKWMVPSAGVFGLFTLSMTVAALSAQFPVFIQLGCQVGLFGLMVICAAAGISGYRQYFHRQEAETLEIRQQALAITADSLLLEKAQGIHPQTLQILLAERNRVWMVVSGTVSPDNKPYTVLKAAPQVTDKFIEFFLDNSTSEQAMPKRMLVEGRKNMFDPSGQVDEYTMYDLFEQVLIQERKLTKPYGNIKPGMWIPPWSPVSVALDLGWEWVEAVDSGQSSVISGQSSVISGQSSVISDQSSAVSRQLAVGKGGESPAWEKAIEGLEQTQLMKKATRK